MNSQKPLLVALTGTALLGSLSLTLLLGANFAPVEIRESPAAERSTPAPVAATLQVAVEPEQRVVDLDPSPAAPPRASGHAFRPRVARRSK